MSNLLNWLRRLRSWLLEASLVWIAMLIIAGALALSFRPGSSELHVRIAGMVLQWLGIGTVALGLHKTRQLFERPSFWNLLRNWGARFPRWRGRIIAGIGTATGGSVALSSRGYGWYNVDPAASIDERVDALAKNVERLNKHLIQVQTDLDTEGKLRSDALQAEQASRLQADEGLKSRLEATATGGLHISFVGAIWLFVGITLSSLPNELAAILK
jgi:hypothetical protein